LAELIEISYDEKEMNDDNGDNEKGAEKTLDGQEGCMSHFSWLTHFAIFLMVSL